MSNDGGPAFPVAHETDGHDGMTLRDFFAAKAMQGMLAHGHGPTASWFADEGMDAIAKWAYIVADAMLAERAKQ